MATGKRYYWIKLKESFMTSDTIDFFMGQTNGANYVVLYQMLLLKTVNTGGRLARQLGEILIPYDVEKIQRDCKYFSLDTIRIALKLYQAVGLIYEDSDGTLVMKDHNEMVGSESDFAKQKREQRRSLMKLDETLGVDKGVDIVHTDIEIDIDKDIDIKREKKTPTLEEISAYIKEKNMSVDPKTFFDYYDVNHWKDVKNWKQKLITWNSHEPKVGKKSNQFHNFDERNSSEYCEQSIIDDFARMMNPPEG